MERVFRDDKKPPAKAAELKRRMVAAKIFSPAMLWIGKRPAQ